MDRIGTVVAKVAASVSRSYPACSTGPIVRSAQLPAPYDMECDVEIPRRVFSAWVPSVGPREIIRPLSLTERAKLENRSVALRNALAPYQPNERNAIGKAISAMLGGYRSMRQEDTSALATVESITRFLAEFPPWAIERGCLLIRCGETVVDPPLNPAFPPNDNQIRAVVKGIVRDYQKSLAIADALLSAAVERRDEQQGPARADIEAKLGRPVGPPPEKQNEPAPEAPHDGKHAQRVMADLAARKARYEGDRA